MAEHTSNQPNKNGLAITGLVLGILSIVLFALLPISTLLGILAIIFGAVSLRSGGKAKAGLILGIIGVLVSIIVFFIIFIALPSLQVSQRDTTRKSDVSQISTYVTSYQADNQGALPGATTVPVADLLYITSIKDSGEPTTRAAIYTPGTDCSGQKTSPRDYSISILLENNSTYCQEF